MGKYRSCGKGGFFHKVNKAGLCQNCERIEKLAIEESQLQKSVESLKWEQEKMQKSVTLNANKLLKAQTLFKSIQYSAKRYFDEESVSKTILAEDTDEADDLLSTTVKLKFNLLDIRELRKRYNQNDKIRIV